jgi:hypothetical protein
VKGKTEKPLLKIGMTCSQRRVLERLERYQVEKIFFRNRLGWVNDLSRSGDPIFDWMDVEMLARKEVSIIS